MIAFEDTVQEVRDLEKNEETSYDLNLFQRALSCMLQTSIWSKKDLDNLRLIDKTTFHITADYMASNFNLNLTKSETLQDVLKKYRLYSPSKSKIKPYRALFESTNSLIVDEHALLHLSNQSCDGNLPNQTKNSSSESIIAADGNQGFMFRNVQHIVFRPADDVAKVIVKCEDCSKVVVAPCGGQLTDDIHGWNPNSHIKTSTSLLRSTVPTTIKHWTLAGTFNGAVNQLPSFITHLAFGLSFNQPVDDLPPTITHLTFGSDFNQPVEHLPPTITHLTFDFDFNQPVEHLPPTITHLTFGLRFNQPVENLPPTITHLTFDFDFRWPVEHLPPTITHLTFGERFNQPVENLPPTVTELTFGRYFNQPVDHLPPTITHLTFGFEFNKPVEHLPLNVTHLTFGGCFNQPVENLPPTITHLTFGGYFNQRVENLPPAITHLTLQKTFSHSVSHLRNTNVLIKSNTSLP